MIRGRLTSLQAVAAADPAVTLVPLPRTGTMPAQRLLNDRALDPYLAVLERAAGVGFPATWRAVLPEARIHAPQFVVATQGGDFLYDSLPAPHRAPEFGLEPERPLPTDFAAGVEFPPDILGMPVTAAYHDAVSETVQAGICMGEPWGHTYFHWVADLLPRLDLLEAPPDPSCPLLCPAPLSRFQAESLRLLGIGPEAVRTVQPGCAAVTRLVYPSRPQRTGFIAPWVVDWLRRSFALPPKQGMGRVFVSRGDAPGRRIANEAAVIDRLRRYGVTVVLTAGMPFAEQVALFRGAELLVGAHGSGLVNALFMREGAALVELLPPSARANPTIPRMAQVAGLRFGAVVGEAVPGDGVEPDFAVDPEAVALMVEAALS